MEKVPEKESWREGARMESEAESALLRHLAKRFPTSLSGSIELVSGQPCSVRV